MYQTPSLGYVMLNGRGSYCGPSSAPYNRVIPRHHHHKKHSPDSSSICFRWFFFLVVLLILIVTVTVISFDPKPPSYEIKNIEVKAFNVETDFSLNTQLSVTVNSENPNRITGIIYENDTSIVLMYEGSSISSGKIPNFHQGPLNVSTIHVELKGKSEFGSGLQQAFSDSKKLGKIPLLVMVKAPVVLVIAGLRTQAFSVYVNCSLVVDSLSPDKEVNILSNSCTYDASFPYEEDNILSNSCTSEYGLLTRRIPRRIGRVTFGTAYSYTNTRQMCVSRPYRSELIDITDS